jgi:hypothetical protein
MSLHGAGFCIMCGAQLETGHRFCWSCGAPRWAPEAGEDDDSRRPAHLDQRPPPMPGTPARRSIAAAPEPTTLGLLPWFYAAGAVFFLVWATQALAVFASPTGRGQLMSDLAKQGYSSAIRPWVLVGQGFFVLGASLVAAGLHATAFYGLRRVRRWGWLAAVVIAGFWSLLVVGIPVLRRLLSPPIRHAYGVD